VGYIDEVSFEGSVVLEEHSAVLLLAGTQVRLVDTETLIVMYLQDREQQRGNIVVFRFGENPPSPVKCGMWDRGLSYMTSSGHAIVQAVSCRLPTAAARVRSRDRSRGICGGQSGTGADFLGVLLFPLPILIAPTAPHSSSSIIQGWYNMPNNGRRTTWTQSHLTP
jgi:hypothetical protein